MSWNVWKLIYVKKFEWCKTGSTSGMGESESSCIKTYGRTTLTMGVENECSVFNQILSLNCVSDRGNDNIGIQQACFSILGVIGNCPRKSE